MVQRNREGGRKMSWRMRLIDDDDDESQQGRRGVQLCEGRTGRNEPCEIWMLHTATEQRQAAGWR